MLAAARLLDLTRLVSRAGRGPHTGIDRVEFAYMTHLLGLDTPVFGLVRSGVGYLLLDRTAMLALQRGKLDLQTRDLVGRLTYRQNPARAAVETALRHVALARCARPLLARMLRRHLPPGAVYLNTGHANLDQRTLRRLHRAGLKIAVLVHDTIPLDYPQYARPDTVDSFRRKMRAVADHADLLIHTTQDSRNKTEAQLSKFGRVPDGIIASLGVPTPHPVPAELPPLDLSHPYFVVLGTIEPRKNHALLLNVWQQLPAPTPTLFIVGSRGWSIESVAARLDALPPNTPIHEVSGLTDGAVAALLHNAHALLFPSFAEGFGLPALEAAAMGVPVIASSLMAFREILGDFPVYLDPSDSYSWVETISRFAKAEKSVQKCKNPPGWAEHFSIVLSRV